MPGQTFGNRRSLKKGAEKHKVEILPDNLMEAIRKDPLKFVKKDLEGFLSKNARNTKDALSQARRNDRTIKKALRVVRRHEALLAALDADGSGDEAVMTLNDVLPPLPTPDEDVASDHSDGAADDGADSASEDEADDGAEDEE
ncbi:hypothetical protein HDV00_012391 [Rhizophlyctis rosea]|nr:hypothetical protein HDV00_012391 [Rhizophlyctis rosea]